MLALLFFSIVVEQSSLITVIEPFNFTFSSFNPDICNEGSLICSGSVNGNNGFLRLTPGFTGDQTETSPLDKVGRVLFHRPVLVWPAVFSTTFTIRISPFPNATISGDGMAFLIAADNSSVPSGSFGSYLGLMNDSTSAKNLRQLAVELDTYKNEWDPDDNHIGIDTNSIILPVAAKSLSSTGIELKSGNKITVKIDYHGWKKQLQISVAYSGSKLVSLLNKSIDLSSIVPSSVYVGFTGATGKVPECHEVLDWQFTSIPLPFLHTALSRKDARKATFSIVVPIIIGFLAAAIAVFPLLRKDLRRRTERAISRGDIESRSRHAANVPKMFTYKQLYKATQHFSKANLLGSGGFGSVYKATVNSTPRSPPSTVAVKKISATSRQGEREYFAEICTIGRLRHKNIVQLLGWCHEGEHLLLVYEFMANGSLDRYIGERPLVLDWPTRYKILTGLASALLYLHEESGNPVVHRDVKPSNVMLDADFNAHLGDFGLARLLQNDASVTTMLAGTPGYMAPEVGFTGRATPESDVYSFGMVVLEVVCGRRSKAAMEENSLVDQVWKLHGKSAMLDCVDSSLEGAFDEEQARRSLVVGLACVHPDAAKRPRMRKVIQVFLNPEEPLMELPETRPVGVFVSLSSSSASTTVDNLGSDTFRTEKSLSLESSVIFDLGELENQDLN